MKGNYSSSSLIDKIWEGDLLNRQEEALHLIRFLENKYSSESSSPFVFNIDSGWGHGKTFFINRLSQQLRLHNYPIVVFDAWRNDYSDDALLSFVSEVCLALESELSNFKSAKKEVAKLQDTAKAFIKKAAPILVATAIKKLTGFTREELNEVSNSDNDESKESDNGNLENLSANLSAIATSEVMKQYTEKKKATESFLESLEKIVKKIEKSNSKQLPVFIFIDELDRCRPTFSIQLLESIKHLFSVAGIYFIISTDTEQLCHSIKSVYGSGFDASRYLKRFFDMEYRLEEPCRSNLADYLFEKSPIEAKLFVPKTILSGITVAHYFADICDFFKLGARDIEQVFSTVKSTTYLTETPLHLTYLLFVICIKHLYPERFETLNVPISLESVKEMFSELRKTGRLDETTRYNFHNKEGKPKSLHLNDLFFTYCDLTHQLQGIGEFISNNQIDPIRREIAIELYNANTTIRNQYGDYQKNVKDSSLKKYHGLILRAGKFSSN